MRTFSASTLSAGKVCDVRCLGAVPHALDAVHRLPRVAAHGSGAGAHDVMPESAGAAGLHTAAIEKHRPDMSSAMSRTRAFIGGSR